MPHELVHQLIFSSTLNNSTVFADYIPITWQCYNQVSPSKCGLGLQSKRSTWLLKAKPLKCITGNGPLANFSSWSRNLLNFSRFKSGLMATSVMIALPALHVSLNGWPFLCSHATLFPRFAFYAPKDSLLLACRPVSVRSCKLLSLGRCYPLDKATCLWLATFQKIPAVKPLLFFLLAKRLQAKRFSLRVGSSKVESPLNIP